MKTVERWQWWVKNDGTGRRYRTSWHMTPEEAAAYPGAVRVDESRQVLQLPESPEEGRAHGTADFTSRPV